MDVGSITSLFSSVSISADWIIAGALALFFTFDALRSGPARVTALALALPLAFLLSGGIKDAAYMGNFVSNATPAVQTGAFIALTFGLFVAFYRIVDSIADSMHLLKALMAGVACAVVLMVVLLQLPDVTLPWTFSDSFNAVFAPAYRLYWLVGAYFALAMARA